MHSIPAQTVGGPVTVVARQAGITEAEADLAIAALLRFLAGRLPSPVVGQIHLALCAESGDSYGLWSAGRG